MTFLFQSAKPQIPEFEPWYAGWRKKCDRIVCFAGWWRPEIRIEKVGDLVPDSAAISLSLCARTDRPISVFDPPPNGSSPLPAKSGSLCASWWATRKRPRICVLLARIASLWHPTKDSCGKQPHELGLSFPNSLARNVAIWQVGTAAEIPSNYELHPKA